MKGELNPANLVTLLRVLLTPVCAWLVLERRCEPALWWCVGTGLTDALDGWLARRFGWMSRVGAYFDPIADKLLMTALYLALASVGLAPLWLTALVIGRDVLILLMTGYAMAYTQFRDFPPSVWGKISTVIQIATIVALLVECAYGGPRAAPWIWAAAAGTAVSGVHYVARAINLLKGAERK